jgi:hypothetical protein
MTGVQAVEKLKQWGYQIILKKDGRISAVLPGGLNAPRESVLLLEDIRRDRESVVAYLDDLKAGYQVVELETQLFRSGDLCAFLGLLWDAYSDKIKFVGDIVYHTETGMLEVYWQPIEPQPFFQPGLSGKDISNFAAERLLELNREKSSNLPIARNPRKIVEEAMLESLLFTAE